MPKGSIELTNARKDEIISACRKLYEAMSFKDITLKEIGQQTSFTRTSIYNYFETKEEIFLALLQKEYELLAEDIDDLCGREESLSADSLSAALAHLLEKHVLMLKLVSMNHFDMEVNARLERLVEFKAAYGGFIRSLDRCLQHFCPKLSADSRRKFLYAFLPFVYGLYPYTVVTEKQRQAMTEGGVDYVYMSTYEMAYACIQTLIGGLQ